MPVVFVSGRVCVQMQTCVTNSFSGAADNVRSRRLRNWAEGEVCVCVCVCVYVCFHL